MTETGKPSVEKRRHDVPIVRLLGIIGWTLTVLIAVMIPLFYYTFAIRSERNALQIETAYTAKAIQSIVFASPDLWEFETVRLLEIVSKRTVEDEEDERTIYDATGKIVVETKYKAPAESITSTAPLFVSGFPSGHVQAKRSVRDILWGTAFAGILGFFFGLVNILFFKSYPLRLLKEALTRLSAEKEKTETTLSSIGDGVMTVDREGRIAYMNPVAEMCTGWRSDEALGRDFKDCYVIRGEGERMDSEVHAPCTLLSRNGEQRTIEEVRSPIKGRNSAEEGHVIVFRDVTEKRNLERQLQQAQKLESLSVLAGGIAHDFNNLLTVVLGNAELVLNELSPMSPAHGSLTEITTAARRAADLSLQMLTYTGKTVFTVERVGLSELVKEMAHLLNTAISKKADLTLDLEPGLPPIQADPTQIRQIVMDLIINASEALGDRSGEITVSVGATRCDEEFLRETELHDDLPPGLYVHLKVTDTGIGMDEKTRSRIFEPFFSTKFHGTRVGIGRRAGDRPRAQGDAQGAQRTRERDDVRGPLPVSGGRGGYHPVVGALPTDRLASAGDDLAGGRRGEPHRARYADAGAPGLHGADRVGRPAGGGALPGTGERDRPGADGPHDAAFGRREGVRRTPAIEPGRPCRPCQRIRRG